MMTQAPEKKVVCVKSGARGIKQKGKAYRHAGRMEPAQVSPQVTPGPEMFTADAWNAVCDYCADGMDAFESCLLQAPALEPQVLEEIKQGNHKLYQDLLSRVESNLGLFEKLCQSTVFRVPVHAMLPQDALQRPSVPMVSESEVEVDQKLSAARAELSKVQQECCELQEEVRQLDADIAANGDVSAFQALATTATANKDSVMEDVAAIAQAAQKLQPLLSRAAQLRAQREPLAARNGNVGGLDFRSTQLMKQTGPTENLQTLNSWLKAA